MRSLVLGKNAALEHYTGLTAIWNRMSAARKV